MICAHLRLSVGKNFVTKEAAASPIRHLLRAFASV
jgi:hypothetical protein